MTTATAQRATTQQIDDMKLLLGRLEARGKDMSRTRASLNECWATELFTVEFAASMIRTMLDLTEELDLKAYAAESKAIPTIPAGRYAIRCDDGHYAFYRVWVGNRATLVYLIVSDDEQRVSRTATEGVLRRIASDGPLEAAKAYGREIGVCGACNRTLTNPDSISAGIGPICAKRY